MICLNGFARVLENVGIVVADEPNERELATMSNPCGELLGLYEGIPVTKRTTGYSGVMPDVITLFKGRMTRMLNAGRAAPTDPQNRVARDRPFFRLR